MKKIIINCPHVCPYCRDLCPKPDHLRNPPTPFYNYCYIKAWDEFNGMKEHKNRGHEFWLASCNWAYLDNGKFPDWCPLADDTIDEQKGQVKE